MFLAGFVIEMIYNLKYAKRVFAVRVAASIIYSISIASGNLKVGNEKVGGESKATVRQIYGKN